MRNRTYREQEEPETSSNKKIWGINVKRLKAGLNRRVSLNDFYKFRVVPSEICVGRECQRESDLESSVTSGMVLGSEKRKGGVHQRC